jgi:hypothetical protein
VAPAAAADLHTYVKSYAASPWPTTQRLHCAEPLLLNFCCSSVPRFLTDKGIEYLREYLNLPADVVPATLKKSARPAGEGRRPPMGGDRPPRGPPREGGYRCALRFLF